MSRTGLRLWNDVARGFVIAATLSAFATASRAGSLVGSLAGGNLVVADGDLGVFEVDPVLDYWVGIVPAGTELGSPRGVAVVADPRGSARPLLVVAFGADDPQVFTADGDPVVSCSTAGHGANDVEAAAEDSTFYSAGTQLFRHELFAGDGFVGCTTTPPTGLADVEGVLGGPAHSLALFEPAGELSAIFLALGAHGIGSFDPADRSLELVAGTPAPPGDVILGVAAVGNALLFTQNALDGFDCESESGVFAAFLGIAPLSQGGLLRCAHAVAPAGSRLFVTERPTMLGGAGSRVVEIAQNPTSLAWEQVRALPTPLEQPFDVEVIPSPEPGHAALAIAAFAALLAPRRRRSTPAAWIAPRRKRPTRLLHASGFPTSAREVARPA